MSSASKCDRCGELFEHVALKTLMLDVSTPTKADQESFSNWEGCEFCPKCSKPILEFIRPALNGFGKK